MRASPSWLGTTERKYHARANSPAFVHLEQYTAELYEAGAGSPIVLIPGLAGGFGLLGPMAATLTDQHRVLAYQLRGENDCFILRHPFDLDDLVDDLAELLDTLMLEKPTIMGVSFGSLIALKFAIRYPHRLDRLIVQGVGARYDGGLLQQVATTVLSRFPLPEDSPFVNQFFNLLFGFRQKRNSLFDFVTEQIWQTDQSVMAHRLRLAEELDLERELHRIKAPTLVLCGERDVFVTPKSLNALCEKIPNVELARLKGCGHLAFVTRPDLINTHIERFLQS